SPTVALPSRVRQVSTPDRATLSALARPCDVMASIAAAGAQGLEVAVRAVAGRAPEAALDRFLESLGDLAKGRRVGLCDEVAHPFVLQIGLVQGVEVMVLDHARGGGEGEQVVDRRGDLEGALVAVAHDAGEPFGVGRAGAHDPADFLLEGADAWGLGA